jgi:anti-sigma factor RsiW
MDCGKYLRQISKYIDGELSEDDGKRLVAHMSECPDCGSFYERMTAINETICSTPLEYNSQALIGKVKDRLAPRTDSDRTPHPIRDGLPVYAMLLVLALGLGNFAGNSLYSIIPHRHADATLELLAPEQENSLAEAILDIGAEGSSK